MDTSKVLDSSILVVDRVSTMERLDDDDELYSELVSIYLEDTPRQLEILRNAIASDDAALIERQAHSVKSASANIGAERVRCLCTEIEKAGREQELKYVKELLHILELEYIKLRIVLG